MDSEKQNWIILDEVPCPICSDEGEGLANDDGSFDDGADARCCDCGFDGSVCCSEDGVYIEWNDKTDDWCQTCKAHVSPRIVDDGIGEYEYCGARGVHRELAVECSTCGNPLDMTIEEAEKHNGP